MTETVIFGVGAAVFALTVWGAVMAGSLALMKVEIDQNPRLDPEDDETTNQNRLRGEY